MVNVSYESYESNRVVGASVDGDSGKFGEEASGIEALCANYVDFPARICEEPPLLKIIREICDFRWNSREINHRFDRNEFVGRITEELEVKTKERRNKTEGSREKE
ncbi:unnamed protein product [Microthlaspi erraticum]|uniref:Uncharacterized protein n=1 Tax=Microthlaspi erraticum TaxID=1685480 RepID=A0A6D2KXA7_9BRAS|nr:unnamed protein product [Microthlaspi erraticum]CAA7046858.1 unnamed protein product [Microthlaspi erraticum]CAA7053734.1 unnamed protein product [Microthlaspi erraticum]